MATHLTTRSAQRHVAQPKLFRYKSEVPTTNYLAPTGSFLITLKAVNGTIMNSSYTSIRGFLD
jgi:hypothetical protein